ncbi:C-C motif chemokine 20-like [Menidia menidia]|nr:unnamed protein product [Menidia menidia]
MAPRSTTLAAALCCFILATLGPGPAECDYANRGCCTSYSRNPVPFRNIVGYKEQTIKENCRMEAIIFYTIKGNAICADEKDEWVKKTLKFLSIKLKRMSKSRLIASGTFQKKPGKLPVQDGSGYLVNSTEVFLNDTRSFY